MSNIKVGDIVKGQVTGVQPYGLFISLEDDYTGLVHISEISDKFVKDIDKLFSIGDIINVKVEGIDEDKRQVKLSIKKIDYRTQRSLSMIPENGSGFKILEEKLKVWTKESYEKIKSEQNN